MATTLERPTGGKARPRFARDLEIPALKLPDGKRIGSVLDVAVAPDGSYWLCHQPNAQGLEPDVEGASYWLPPIVHLSADDRFLGAFGKEHVPAVDGISQWPAALEGLECDGEGNLWLFGYKEPPNEADSAVLKLSPTGELLLRIGQRGVAGDDRDTAHLNAPTACYHDIATREVFVSDGYGNRRIIGFNSDTGAFTRMWGAYGKQPWELTEEESYARPVHDVACGPDGHLYVSDRTRGRVQEFELVPGGARYLREVWLAQGTSVFGTGAAWNVEFSPDGQYLYVGDGANFRIWILDRETMAILGATTAHDEYEIEANRPIHFSLVHRFAVEPNGDMLLACVNRGLRRLKFIGVS
jgi:sugar lactone lactonase YvrE